MDYALRRLVWFLILLVGCVDAEPPIVVTPSTVAIDAHAWELDVEAAARAWTDAGCPLELGEGGAPVVAVAIVDWPYASHYLGMTEGARVSVVAELAADRRLEVLTHELGHLIGVSHRASGIMMSAGGSGAPTVDDCAAR